MKAMWIVGLLLAGPRAAVSPLATPAGGVGVAGSLARGGDDARGVQLLKEGKFAEAVVALRAAAEAAPADAEVQYNLALALWRAGQPQEAEIAAEKAATLSDGALAALRDGILGNVQMDAAQKHLAAQPPDLQAALQSAQKARDDFVHGAVMADAPAELARNLERALKLIADIEKKIEEQKQQEDKKDDDSKKDDEKKDDDKNSDDKKSGDKKSDDKKDDKKSDENKDDKGEQKPKDDKPQDDKAKDDPSKSDESGKPQDKDGKADDKPKDDPSKSDQQQGPPKNDQAEPPPNQGQNEDKPEPKPSDKPDPGKEPKPQPQADDAHGDDRKQPDLQQPQAGDNSDKPEPAPANQDGAEKEAPPPATGAVGQPEPGRELSPEQTKRLLERLQAILEQKAEMEKAQKAQRPRVKKDW